jgi:serine/threonine-protein kinase
VIVAEGAVLGGKLRLEQPLANGGMGAVWVARHLVLDTRVAVKVMDAQRAASAADRARFEREAKAAASVNSLHVVRVLDYGVEDDTPYIVMELLEGEDLGARLRRKGRMSLRAAREVLAPIGKALGRLHEAGLVHRDLKPSNIFLERKDDQELIKLLDFGLVKTLDDAAPAVTTSGSMLGTPNYMSPEQVVHTKSVDHRTDLWSVGVILYEMLTGRLPFSHDNVGALLVAICTWPFPRPSTLVAGLGPEVDRFFDRALAREPSERFQSIAQLVEAFTRLPDGETSIDAIPGESAPPHVLAPLPQAAAGRGASTGARVPARSALDPEARSGARRAMRALSGKQWPRLALGGALVLTLGLLAMVALRGARTSEARTPSAEPVLPEHPTATTAPSSEECPSPGITPVATTGAHVLASAVTSAQEAAPPAPSAPPRAGIGMPPRSKASPPEKTQALVPQEPPGLHPAREFE